MQLNQQPHRPGPLHQTNKAHKGGRHSRKSSATSQIRTKSLGRVLSNQNRSERLNQAHQARKFQREKVNNEKRRIGTESFPPLIVGILDFYRNSSSKLIDDFDNLDDTSLSIQRINDREAYLLSTRLKFRFRLIALDLENHDESLDLVKNVDILLLIHRANSVEHYDYTGSPLYRAIYIHCLPTIVHVVVGHQSKDDPVDIKRLLFAKKILRHCIKEEKIHSIEKVGDYQQLLHLLGSCKKISSRFRDVRPSIVGDACEIVDNSLAITGFVRKSVLSPNDLVHLVGFGDYQIKRIDILPDPYSLKGPEASRNDVVQSLCPDPMKQETLEQENDIDPMEGEQTWPTAEELAAEAERQNNRKIVRKLPAGTSEYQGAWILEDSDSDAEDQSVDSEDEDGEAMMDILDSEDEAPKSDEMEKVDEESEPEIAEERMDVVDYDRSHSKDKEMKILEKLKESRLQEMFPDELDTPADIPARVRFARYRGLKSFRTSPWDPQENLPPDYSRIFQFQNFQQTKKRILSERNKDGADPGQYVRVILDCVPENIKNHIISSPQIAQPMIGLMKHERRMTVMNILIKKTPDCVSNNPVKSKDELIFYVGFRKFKARPIFTTHSVSSKFKYERFFRDDVAMVATVYAPITFPPAPVLVYRENHRGDKELIASGSVLDSNPNRIVVKRIRLSGHPFKIHSKSCVVRFMFFNSEDVDYFKPVELVTKYNRRGHITEALGTHGHMKCLFDKKIRSDDCIFMNLYKRVFPKWTYSPIVIDC